MKEYFQTHLNQEFPPKVVFCVNDELEVRSIAVEDIDSLTKDFDYLGHTKGAHFMSEFSEFPSLPMIARKQNGS